MAMVTLEGMVYFVKLLHTLAAESNLVPLPRYACFLYRLAEGAWEVTSSSAAFFLVAFQNICPEGNQESMFIVF